jgi:Na+-translocating ferredoxin:NAD+ oxidoreductase RnfG subunit
MRIKSGIFIILSLLSLAFTSGLTEVDYKHKTLLKALQKVGVVDMSAIEEVVLPDSVNTANRIQGKYFLINDNNVSQYRYIYIGRVNSCRAGGCSITNENPHDSNSEYFDYYILFDSNKTVQAVKVFNYQASHGQEITAKGWLKQFIGHNGSEPLQVDKNIDAISGATISVYAITIDIELKTEILHNLM